MVALFVMASTPRAMSTESGDSLRARDERSGVDSVGEDSSEEVDDEAGRGAEEVDDSERERRFREVVGEPPQRDDGHLLAGDLCHESHPEQAEVSVDEGREEVQPSGQEACLEQLNLRVRWGGSGKLTMSLMAVKADGKVGRSGACVKERF